MPNNDENVMANSSDSSTENPNGSVHFCPLCGKPFTLVPSYNRHLSYCRRTQTRPRNRLKSCRACNVAKAKCSFHVQCSRCVAKGIDCSYDLPTVTKDARASTAMASQSDQSKTSAAPEESSLPGFVDWGDNSVLDLTDLHHFDQCLYNGFGDVDDGLAISNISGELSMLHDIDPSPGSHNLTHGTSTDNTNLLTRLSKPEPLVRQSASLITGALCAIPEQMVRRATLPPFIHPHWHCPAMPEPLAICMRIAQMFTTRTPDIKPFIWRTILTEHRRVIEQLSTLSKQDLLAAIQAQVVYLIMCVVDGGSQPPGWIQEIATSSSIVCQRFVDICGGHFCEGELSNPSITWEDWIFAESRRRTSCIWYLITRTIVVETIAGCPTVEYPATLPLPSPKTQWEARSRTTWIEELDAGSPAIGTLGNLMNSSQRCQEASHAQLLDAWNARADNLGSLLNIAVTMT